MMMTINTLALPRTSNRCFPSACTARKRASGRSSRCARRLCSVLESKCVHCHHHKEQPTWGVRARCASPHTELGRSTSKLSMSRSKSCARARINSLGIIICSVLSTLCLLRPCFEQRLYEEMESHSRMLHGKVLNCK